jgi:hypothetical protein
MQPLDTIVDRLANLYGEPPPPPARTLLDLVLLEGSTSPKERAKRCGRRDGSVEDDAREAAVAVDGFERFE